MSNNDNNKDMKFICVICNKTIDDIDDHLPTHIKYTQKLKKRVIKLKEEMAKLKEEQAKLKEEQAKLKNQATIKSWQEDDEE